MLEILLNNIYTVLYASTIGKFIKSLVLEGDATLSLRVNTNSLTFHYLFGRQTWSLRIQYMYGEQKETNKAKTDKNLNCMHKIRQGPQKRKKMHWECHWIAVYF